MELRKLQEKEHDQTRMLWEEVFSEDSKAFLDYYYFIKTRTNEILVIEEEGAIRSMLQLNPYLLRIEEGEYACHYIIAVATEEAYRKRGYMGRLLRRGMEEMYKRKEPFTFLMPAAAEIYTPYDFRFIYEQQQAETGEAGQAPAKKNAEDNIIFADAALADAEEMGVFFQENFRDHWQVYAMRDREYYQTLIFEQQSENGGIRLMRADGKIAGMFCYADEDGLEMRELLYLQELEDVFWEEIFRFSRDRGQSAKLFACPCGIRAEKALKNYKKEPLIMARILHLESLLSAMKVKQGEEMSCSFAVLDSFLPANGRIWKVWGGRDTDYKVQVRETEDSEGVITIGALTGFLFGTQTAEEIRKEAHVILTEHLAEELQKLQVLKTVWLNEIV